MDRERTASFARHCSNIYEHSKPWTMHEPSSPFITSVLELKLDTNTMFEWQKHSQDSTDMPHYQKLLEFINLSAQASEAYPFPTTSELLVMKSNQQRITLLVNPLHSLPPALQTLAPIFVFYAKQISICCMHALSSRLSLTIRWFPH